MDTVIVKPWNLSFQTSGNNRVIDIDSDSYSLVVMKPRGQMQSVLLLKKDDLNYRKGKFDWPNCPSPSPPSPPTPGFQYLPLNHKNTRFQSTKFFLLFFPFDFLIGLLSSVHRKRFLREWLHALCMNIISVDTTHFCLHVDIVQHFILENVYTGPDPLGFIQSKGKPGNWL